DLVHVAHTGQPGTEVQELVDPRLGGQVPDGAAEEGPVLAYAGAARGPRLDHPLGDLPVGGEVVLPAEEVVVHPGRMRPGPIDLRNREPFLPARCGTPPLSTLVPYRRTMRTLRQSSGSSQRVHCRALDSGNTVLPWLSQEERAHYADYAAPPWARPVRCC